MHQFRVAYPGITEDELRWRDWDWIYDRLEKIQRDRREARRWQMMCHFASIAAGTHGGESMAEWQRMFHSLYSEAEQKAAALADQEQQEREIAAQNEKALAEYLARLSAGGPLTLLETGGGDI